MTLGLTSSVRPLVCVLVLALYPLYAAPLVASAADASQVGRKLAFIAVRRGAAEPQVARYLRKAGYTAHVLVGTKDLFHTFKKATAEYKVRANDTILLCYDDIMFNDFKEDFNMWIDDLLSLNNTGFLGAVGSAVFKGGDKNFISEEFGEHQYQHFDNLRGFVASSSPPQGLKHMMFGLPGHAVVLDGAFLAVKGAVLARIVTSKPKDFLGRWQFLGEYYSLQAHILGYNNYVAPLHMSHNAVACLPFSEQHGELSPESMQAAAMYMKNQERFTKMLKKKLPLKLRKQQVKGVSALGQWGRRLAFIVTRDSRTAYSLASLPKAQLKVHGFEVRLIVNATSYFDAFEQVKTQVKDTDQVIICHDDISFVSSTADLTLWLDLVLSKESAGFAGVAGTLRLWEHGRWSVPMPKMEMGMGRVDDPEWYPWGQEHGYRGQVLYRKHVKWSYFGGYGRALVMDGVFLAARGDFLLKMDFSKPASLPGHWDAYDAYATFTGHLAGHLNYVVPVSLVHDSHGGNADEKRWNAQYNAFAKLFASDLPAALHPESTVVAYKKLLVRRKAMSKDEL